jgi:hypothetical protein
LLSFSFDKSNDRIISNNLLSEIEMALKGFKPQWDTLHSKVAKEFEEGLVSKKTNTHGDTGDFMKWLNDKS